MSSDVASVMDHSFLAAADDLDKVLDDFEKNEEVSPDFRVTSQQAVKKSLHTTPGSTTKIAHHNMNGDSTNHTSGPTADLIQNNYGSTQLPGGSTQLPVGNTQIPMGNAQIPGGGTQLPGGTIITRDKSDTVTSTDSDFQLDLSEADFAPSPQTLPPMLSSLSFLQNNDGDINSHQSGIIPPQHQNNGTEETRYARSDSNTQLNQQDFASYLPTNTDRTLSFGDLQSMNTSPTHQETSYAQNTPSREQTLVMSHDTTLTHTSPRKDMINSDVLNYMTSNRQNSYETSPSSQHITTSSTSPVKGTTVLPSSTLGSIVGDSSPPQHLQNSILEGQGLQNSVSKVPSLQNSVPEVRPSQSYTPGVINSDHNVYSSGTYLKPVSNSEHSEHNSALIHTENSVDSTLTGESQPNNIQVKTNSEFVHNVTQGLSAPLQQNLKPNVNSSHGPSAVSDGVLQINLDVSGVISGYTTTPGIAGDIVEQTSAPVVENSELRNGLLDSNSHVEINGVDIIANRTPDGTNGEIISNEQQSTNVELSNANTTHSSENKEVDQEDPSGESPVVSSLPDPRLMDEYVKQGARPKTLLPGSSPKHSPLKANGTTDDSSSSNVKKGGKNTQPEQPDQPQPSKTVIGFQSIDNITVTDADLDALEEEDSSVPQGSIQGPVQLKGQLGVVGNMDDSGRLSPISKLLGQQGQQVSSSVDGNELTSMDPFYNANLATQDAPAGGHLNGSMQGDQSMVAHQDVSLQSSLSNGGPSSDTNSSVPKSQTNHANTNSQLNNSNSQLANQGTTPTQQGQPQGQVEGQPRGQVDSLMDMSNNALQGLTLAMNATTISPPGVGGGSPQHKPHQGIDPSPHAGIPPPSHHTGIPSQHPGMPSNQGQSQYMQNDQTLVPPGADPTSSTHRTQRSTPPSAFQLPPPEDPPSYQEVSEATRLEAQQASKPKLRQSLSLNFEQPAVRKTTAQPIPPSPVVEDATPPDSTIENPQPNSSEVPSQLDNRLVDPQNGPEGSQQQLLHPPGNVPPQENTDFDSRTSSIETDSDHDDFPPGLVPELSQELIQLGNVAPVWLPDSEATCCMMCQGKFTFRKRRHHCRACGKIFCSKCCSTRIKLKYMDSKEARVCVSCLNTILRAQSLQRQQGRPPGSAPDPRNPAEYCSTVPPTQQASQGAIADAAAAQPPSVMVPVNKSSLRRPSEGSQKETRRVRFSDGIHPGVDQGELAATPKGTNSDKLLTNQNPPSVNNDESQTGPRRRLLNHAGSRSLIPRNEGALPPIIVTTEVKGEFMVEENPDVEQLIADLRSEDTNPVVFVLNKNLLVMVKIVNLNCCVNRTCWCFSTKGMVTAGQDEIVIVLECLPDEKMVPKDIFTHFQTVYEEAAKGNTVSHMSHTLCTQPGFLGSRDHGGFLYLQPSFQCLRQLILPESPYLFAVLLQKWETPWAKVFPLRLLLRLGAEFRYYPCPLMSVRFRKPVFGEIGHTIMNLLADFKNYQYLLPVIPGVTILMKDRETTINFPKNRYDDVMKVLNNSNEHVMALAANFSLEADSHLVCIQNDDGSYQTQAINIQNKPRKVTGASFVVFNGALKSSSGLTAKSSIVEDGLMVQIRPEMMTSLRQAIREMQNYTIPCKSVTVELVEETVCVKWVEDDQKFNVGVTSPIDGRSMEGVESVRIHNGTDFRGKTRSLRWTEVFFLENNEPIGKHGHHEPVDLSKFAESLSMAFSIALSNHLDELREMGLAKLGLRVTIDTEKVGYEAGAKSQQLPPIYMNELDNELIPVLHNAVSQHQGGPVVLELVFHIIE